MGQLESSTVLSKKIEKKKKFLLRLLYSLVTFRKAIRRSSLYISHIHIYLELSFGHQLWRPINQMSVLVVKLPQYKSEIEES